MKCPVCGKQLSLTEKLRAPAVIEADRDEKFCSTLCFQRYIEGFESRKSCRACAHFEEPRQVPDSTVPIRQKTTHSFHESLYDILAAHCRETDLKLRPTIISVFKGGYAGSFRRRDFFLDAEKCIHYTTKEEYRDKALRGELGTEKEAYYVICRYCKVRYNANANVRCPNCGAANT